MAAGFGWVGGNFSTSTDTLPVKAAITLRHLIFPLALALTWHGSQDGFHLFSRRLRKPRWPHRRRSPVCRTFAEHDGSPRRICPRNATSDLDDEQHMRQTYKLIDG